MSWLDKIDRAFVFAEDSELIEQALKRMDMRIRPIPISDSVIMVGNKSLSPLPRGYRDPPIISDEAVGDIEIIFEEVMSGFAPIYVNTISSREIP